MSRLKSLWKLSAIHFRVVFVVCDDAESFWKTGFRLHSMLIHGLTLSKTSIFASLFTLMFCGIMWGGIPYLFFLSMPQTMLVAENIVCITLEISAVSTKCYLLLIYVSFYGPGQCFSLLRKTNKQITQYAKRILSLFKCVLDLIKRFSIVCFYWHGLVSAHHVRSGSDVFVHNISVFFFWYTKRF